MKLDPIELLENPKDLILGPYKLPLKKVEEGFGYYGAISLTADNKYIQCHVCGRLRKNLSLFPDIVRPSKHKYI